MRPVAPGRALWMRNLCLSLASLLLVGALFVGNPWLPAGRPHAAQVTPAAISSAAMEGAGWNAATPTVTVAAEARAPAAATTQAHQAFARLGRAYLFASVWALPDTAPVRTSLRDAIVLPTAPPVLATPASFSGNDSPYSGSQR